MKAGRGPEHGSLKARGTRGLGGRGGGSGRGCIFLFLRRVILLQGDRKGSKLGSSQGEDETPGRKGEGPLTYGPPPPP